MNIHRLLSPTLAALAVMLCTPVPGPAQSILQSAGNYALLGGTLISVGGPGPNSIVNGNVGLWSAATTNITGFPPATVTGITQGGSAAAIIATGPLTTGQAYADLQKAHVGLAGMASSANVSNVDLGTMAPLFSGVYTFNGAASQTGALILDAQGHNGVTWVFQIGTSLTTAANSSVTFINLGTNGGSDLGVFWNAGAGITIGNNNTILGNYIAGTSISFTGSTSTGGAGGTRALALAAISFAGPGTINALGGPGGGDFSGGLMYDPLTGAVVLKPAPGGTGGSGGTGGGGGTPTGTVLLGSTGTYTPGASGVTLVQGTQLATTTTVLDGTIANGTAPAALTVTTATVTLTGANTYTGGTTVNGGTLVTGSSNLPANQPVALANSGGLVFNQPADGSFGGVISGAGSVTKQGAGALTLTGTDTYTGGTNVTGGSLVASTATLPANGAVTVTSGSSLVFNQAAAGAFGGTIVGGGTIRKSGAGVLTLTRPTTSPVDVQAGSLYFTDGLGTTTIEPGAFLGGNGTIYGNLINSGTLSPGNSPGTITVTGSYTQTPTGTLIIELASGASFDHLTVNGTAALAGTLQVNTLGGFNPVGQSFTFLTAVGGVSGTFTTVNGTAIVTGSAAIAANIVYGPTSVAVAIVQLPFAGFAHTPNQRAVANAASASPALTTALDAVPTAGELPAAFNALSPQGVQVWSDLAFGHATALTDRLLRDDGALPDHDDFYFDASQRRGRAQADLDVGANTFTSTAGLVGGDRVVSQYITAGGFFSYSEANAGLGSPGSRTRVKDKMPGLRVTLNDGPWFAHAILAYGFDDYTSSRPVAFTGTAATATGSTSGRQWLADVTAGRNFTSGILTLSPFVGLMADRWHADGFTETGAGAANVTYAGQSAHSLRSQVGLEAQLAWKFGWLVLQPHVRAAWLSEFANGARRIDAAFGAVDYSVVSRSPQRESALLTAGLDVVLDPRAVLYTEYTAQSGDTTHYLSDWRVGLSVRF